MNPEADAPKTGRKAMWCHGDMTCTCGEVIGHQDVIDALRHPIYEAEAEQLTRPFRHALSALLATLGDTAIVPPQQLAAARAVLGKPEGKE